MEEFLKFLEAIKVNKNYSKTLLFQFLNTRWLDNILKAELLYYAALHSKTEDECINLCLEALKYYSNFRKVYALMAERSTSHLREYSIKVLEANDNSHDVYTHQTSEILQLAKTYVEEFKVKADIAVVAARIALRQQPTDVHVIHGSRWVDVWADIVSGVKIILYFGDLFTKFGWTVRDLFCAGTYIKATDTDVTKDMSIVYSGYGLVCDIYRCAKMEMINGRECQFLDSRDILIKRGKLVKTNKVFRCISDL